MATLQRESSQQVDNQGSHTQIRTMPCPNCGNELRFSRRTVQVTCRCGKTYRIRASR